MIEIKELYFGYGKQSLFKNLNLKLGKGHIYGLLGKNGAGKSTLLKNITGLAFPQSGKCYFNGIDVSGRPVEVLSDLFFLAEDVFVPSLTCVQFAARTGGFYPDFSKSDFLHYMQALDVDAHARMDQQSFGQQKKAMIAFGLATNTRLLVMDEPTNGLDIPSKVQFRKLIASVLTEDRSIIISTHQVRDLDSLIDTLLILNDHEIVINHSLDYISEQLIFGVYPDTRDLPVVYEEEGVRGKNAILHNRTGKFSKVDLELLFNAVIAGNHPILDILNKGNHAAVI